MSSTRHIHSRWSIKYAANELAKRVSPDLPAQRLELERASDLRRFAQVEAYAAGAPFELPPVVAMELVALDRLRAAALALLQDGEGRTDQAGACLLGLRSHQIELTRVCICLRTGDNRWGPDRFESVMLAVASAASFGWLHAARKTTALILELLPHDAFYDAYGKPGDKITKETPRRCFSWFALRLLALWSLGHIPDGLPHHPYPAPEYDALLPHWDTNDLALLTELLLAVCDRHTHEAVYSRSSLPSRAVDFMLDPYMAWPVEVHMLFRLRDSMGLPNPLDLDHPLMKTPLAVYTPEPWPVPHDDLLDRVTARALREYPELVQLL